MNDLFSKCQLSWSREVVFTLGFNRVSQSMPPFQGKRGRQNGGVPSLLSLWHPEHLCFDQFSMFEFCSLRLHFLKRASGGIWEPSFGNNWSELNWDLAFYPLLPLSLKTTFQVFMACHRSREEDSKFICNKFLLTSEMTYLTWAERLTSTWDAQSSGPPASVRAHHFLELPFQDEELPLFLGGRSTAVPSSSFFSVICYNYTSCPKQKDCVFLVLSPITEKAHCIV